MLISSKLLECESPWYCSGHGEKGHCRRWLHLLLLPHPQRPHKWKNSSSKRLEKRLVKGWKSHCPQYIYNTKMMNMQGRRVLWGKSSSRERQHLDVCLTQKPMVCSGLTWGAEKINPGGPTTSLWGPSSRETLALASPIPPPSQPQKGRAGGRKGEKWVE